VRGSAIQSIAVARILLAAFFLAPGAARAAPLRVLFVGNSLTYYNDVPSLVTALVRSADPQTSIETDMLADAGATMRDHLSDGAFSIVLDAGHYDVVVLQDRGSYPMCSRGDAACADSEAAMCEAAKRVVAAYARAVWYGTWQMIPQAQQILSEDGRRAARRCGTEFADVGAAMQRARERGVANLWLADGHPAIAGSWVAASVLARAITGRRVRPPGTDSPCRRRWEKRQLTRRELASRQPASAEDCAAFDPRILAIAVSATNAAPRRR
jgi:hypothetical protein